MKAGGLRRRLCDFRDVWFVRSVAFGRVDFGRVDFGRVDFGRARRGKTREDIARRQGERVTMT